MFIDPRVAGRTAKNFGSITKVTYGLGGNDASLARSFTQEIAKRSALQAQSKIPVSAGVPTAKPLVPNTGTPSPVVSGTAQKLAIAKGVAGFLAIAALAEVGARTIAAAGEMSRSTLSATEAGLKSAQASERLADAKLQQALGQQQEKKQKQKERLTNDANSATNGAINRPKSKNWLEGSAQNPFPTEKNAVLRWTQVVKPNNLTLFVGYLGLIKAVRKGSDQFDQWGDCFFRLETLSSSDIWNIVNISFYYDSPSRGNYAFPTGIYFDSDPIIPIDNLINPSLAPDYGQAPLTPNSPNSNFRAPTLGTGLGSQLGKPKSKSPTPRVPQQQQKQENPTPTPSSPVSQKPDLPAPSQPPVTGGTQKGRSFIEINGQKIFLDEPPKQSFIEFGNGDLVDLSNRPKTPSYIEFANGRRVNLEPQKTPSFLEIGGKRVDLDAKPNQPSFMEVNGVRTYFAKDNQPSFIEINGVRTYLPSAAPTAPATTPTTPKPPEKQDEERRAVPFTPTIPNTPTETPRIPTVPPQPTNPVQPNPNNVPTPTPNTTPINPTQPTPTPNTTPTQPPNSTPTNPPPNLQDILQLTALTVGGIDLLKQGVNNLTNKVNNIDANTSPESLANAAQTGSCRSLKDANCTQPLRQSISQDTAQQLNPLQTGINNLSNILSPFITAMTSNIGKIINLLNNQVVDRFLAVANLATSVHNAAMLTRDIGETLLGTVDNALSLVGFRFVNSEGQQVGATDIIGQNVQAILVQLLGADNYAQLILTWQKANTVYHSAMQVLNTTQSLIDPIASGIESAMDNIGIIGNQIADDRVVFRQGYAPMKEEDNRARRINRFQVIQERLEGAEQIASNLSNVVSTAVNVKEDWRQLVEDKDNLLASIENARNTKQAELDAIKENLPTQIAQITIAPAPEDNPPEEDP